MVQSEIIFTALTKYTPPAPLHTLQTDYDFASSLSKIHTPQHIIMVKFKNSYLASWDHLNLVHFLQLIPSYQRTLPAASIYAT
jgi:hypothetical protein